MIETIIAALAIFVLQKVTPFWWWIMVVPLIVALVRPMSAWRAWRMGMVSAGSVWLIAAVVLYFTTSHIIASRIAQMVNIGPGWMLIIVTALVAALAGGVAGAAGQAVRSRFGSKAPDSAR